LKGKAVIVHAAPVRVRPDDDGLALQLRILQLLHRDEECVHVDVKDLGHRGLGAGDWGLGKPMIHGTRTFRSSARIRECSIRPTCPAICKMFADDSAERKPKRVESST